MVVLNITPQLTHLGTLCFLRGLFRRLVATKPTSCFKYRSSCYVRAETLCLSADFVPSHPVVNLCRRLKRMRLCQVTCFGFTPAAAAPDTEEEQSPEARAQAGMAATKERILSTLRELAEVEASYGPANEAGWRSGKGDRDVLAPVADVAPAELLRAHYHAMGALLSPLWRLQCDVIGELLQRAERSGVSLVE